MMLLRMYLSPLAKDDDEEIEEQEETKVEGVDYSLKNEEGSSTGLGATLGSARPADNAATMEDLESGFTMNIPDED